MKAISANKSDWVRMLTTITAFQKEVRIVVDNGKAICLTVDPAKVAIVKAAIECQGECDPFTVNGEQFLKALNAAGNDPIIEFDDNMSQMTLRGTAKVKVPLLVDMGEIKDINREMFNECEGKGKFTPASVEPIIGYGMYTKEQVVVFNIKDNKMQIVVGTGSNLASFDDFEGTGQASSIYPLDYFSTTVKQMSGAENVDVSLPRDSYPVLMEWQIGTGDYSVVIAPRIEEE